MLTKTLLFCEAIGADAVACPRQQRAPDQLLAAPDRLQVQPLLPNPDALAPGAANDRHHPEPSPAENLCQQPDPLGVEANLARTHLSLKRSPHQVLVLRHTIDDDRSDNAEQEGRPQNREPLARKGDRRVLLERKSRSWVGPQLPDPVSHGGTRRP